MHTKLRWCAILFLVALSFVSHAQDYPTRPIRLIVPFAPGGATDILARMIAQKLTESWRQQVVVDNRPGASGNMGTAIAAGAAPDGYTLLMGYDGTLVINPLIFSKPPYETLRDFAPVTKVADVPIVIVAHPAVPASSLKELIALAKAKPGQVTYSSAGIGSTPHLAGELLRLRAGIDLVRDGCAKSNTRRGDIEAAQRSRGNAQAAGRQGKTRRTWRGASGQYA